MLLDSELVPMVASFLFVFALVYALLVYSKLFPSTRNASGILAIVIAFFAVMYSPLVNYMQDFLPIAAIVLVILFFVVLVKKLLFEGKEGAEKEKNALPAVVMLGAVLLVIGLIWDKMPLGLSGVSSNNLLWLIGIIVIFLIFFAIYKHPNPRK